MASVGAPTFLQSLPAHERQALLRRAKLYFPGTGVLIVWILRCEDD
jgi:hypothetical protein